MAEPVLFEKDKGVAKGEGTAYVIMNYLTGQSSSKVSVAVSELNGRMWKTLNKVSDRAYYFVEGNAKFIFDKKTLAVKTGDVLFVPANTPYTAEGKFKAVLINSPPFDPKNEVKLD